MVYFSPVDDEEFGKEMNSYKMSDCKCPGSFCKGLSFIARRIRSTARSLILLPPGSNFPQQIKSFLLPLPYFFPHGLDIPKPEPFFSYYRYRFFCAMIKFSAGASTLLFIARSIFSVDCSGV